MPIKLEKTLMFILFYRISACIQNRAVAHDICVMKISYSPSLLSSRIINLVKNQLIRMIIGQRDIMEEWG